MRPVRVALVALCLLAGCSNPPVPIVPDGGCAAPCGSACCEAGKACNPQTLTCETACFPTTCTALGAECGTPPNGCGGTLACGACGAGQGCGTDFQCSACASEDDLSFCLRNGLCGVATAPDNCGVSRTRDCGPCRDAGAQGLDAELQPGTDAGPGAPDGGAAGDDASLAQDAAAPPPSDGGPGVPDACTPEDGPALCAAAGRACGTFNPTDRCGVKRSVDCGGCPDNGSCTLGQCIACVPQCSGRSCGDNACGGTCGSCGANQVCDTFGQCVAGGVPNDDCAAPEEIDLSGGVTGSASGDTTNAKNDTWSPGCNAGGTAPEVAYFFKLSTASRVEVTVTPTGTKALQPTVYVRRSCSSEQVGDEVACGVAAAPAATARAVIPSASATTYYVLVDALNGTVGPFDLSIRLDPPATAPANDACSGALDLVFQGTVATAEGTTWLASDSGLGSCLGKSTAPDVVYKLHLDAAHDVLLEVLPELTYKPAVYLTAAPCGSGAELTCGTSLNPGAGALAEATNLQPGDYYVWVDGIPTAANPGYPGDRGDYLLNVTLEPPTTQVPDGCGTVQALNFDANGKVVVDGTTAAATDSGGGYGACTAGAGSPDVVYSFELTGPQSIIASVDTTFGAYWPMLYVRRADCSSASMSSQSGCVAPMTGGKGVAMALADLPTGTYYAWVDGMYASSGGFTLQLAKASAPANDTCGGAIALVANVSVAGTTFLANNDYAGMGPLSGSCTLTPNYASLTGPDAVYSFTPAADGPFTVAVTPQGLYNPAIWVGTACGGTSSCVAISDVAGGKETLTVQGTRGTQYFIVVDSTAYSDKAGNFTISVTQ